jgi:arabinofuranosyltransferase
MDVVESYLKMKNVRLALLVLIVLGGTLGVILTANVVDDAYITFRYADNFVHGRGIVFNQGEYVEGYSNFLWLMTISSFMFLGLKPVIVSQLLGVVFYVGSCLLIYLFGEHLFRDFNHRYFFAVLTVFSFASSRSTLFFSTSGMEHSLFIFLLLISAYFLFVREDVWLANLCFLLLILTRLEGLLFFVLANGFFFLEKRKYDVWKKQLLSVVVALSVFAAYLLWKFFYYHSLLPNTFYTKVSGFFFGSGLRYTAGFVLSYPIMIVLLPFFIYALFSKMTIVRYFSVATLLYCAYLIGIGGDYMGYRLINQVFIFYCLAGFFGFLVFVSDEQRQKHTITTITMIIMLSLILIPIIRGEVYTDVSLNINILDIETQSNWVQIGERLAASNLPENTSIAITAAGAIPYYSKLYTLDMLGLSDSNISRSKPIDARAGHRKQATYAYLMDKKINFVIAHPDTTNCETLCEKNYTGVQWFLPAELLNETKIGLRLNRTDCLRVFYLTKTPSLDNYLEINKNYKVCPT